MTKLRNALLGTRGITAALVAGATILTSVPGMATPCNTVGNWRDDGDYAVGLRLLVRDQSSHDRWSGTPQDSSTAKTIGKDYLPMIWDKYYGDSKETLDFTVNQANTGASIKCSVTASIRKRTKSGPFGKETVNEIRYESSGCDTSASEKVDITCTHDWNDTRARLNVRYTLVDR